MLRKDCIYFEHAQWFELFRTGYELVNTQHPVGGTLFGIGLSVEDGEVGPQEHIPLSRRTFVPL